MSHPPKQPGQLVIGSYIHPDLLSTPENGPNGNDGGDMTSLMLSPSAMYPRDDVHGNNNPNNNNVNNFGLFNNLPPQPPQQQHPTTTTTCPQQQQSPTTSTHCTKLAQNTTTVLTKQFQEWLSHYQLPCYPTSIMSSSLESSPYPYNIPINYPQPISLADLTTTTTSTSSNSQQTPQQQQQLNPIADPLIAYVIAHSQCNPNLIKPIRAIDSLTISVRDIVDFSCQYLTFHLKLSKRLFPQLFQTNTNQAAAEKQSGDGKSQMKMLAILGFSHENRLFNLLKFRFIQLLLEKKQIVLPCQNKGTQITNNDNNNTNNVQQFAYTTTTSPTNTNNDQNGQNQQHPGQNDQNDQNDCFLQDTKGYYLTTVLSEGSTDTILDFFPPAPPNQLQQQQNTTTATQNDQNTSTPSNNRFPPNFFEDGLTNTVTALRHGDYMVVQAPIINNILAMTSHLELILSSDYRKHYNSVPTEVLYSPYVDNGVIINELLGIQQDNSQQDDILQKMSEKVMNPAATLGDLPTMERQNPKKSSFRCAPTVLQTHGMSFYTRGVVDFLIRNDSFDTTVSKRVQPFTSGTVYTYDLWDTKLHSNPEVKDVLQVLLYAYALNQSLEEKQPIKVNRNAKMGPQNPNQGYTSAAFTGGSYQQNVTQNGQIGQMGSNRQQRQRDAVKNVGIPGW
jgi:hypothetical protein